MILTHGDLYGSDGASETVHGSNPRKHTTPSIIGAWARMK